MSELYISFGAKVYELPISLQKLSDGALVDIISEQDEDGTPFKSFAKFSGKVRKVYGTVRAFDMAY